MRVQRVWTPPRSYSCHAVARARVAAVHRVAATDHRGVQLQIVSSVPVSRCSRSRTSSQDATPSAPISNACKHDNQLAPRRRAASDVAISPQRQFYFQFNMISTESVSVTEKCTR